MPVVLRIANEKDSKLLSDLGKVCFTEAFGQYNSPEDLKTFLAETYDEIKIADELKSDNCTYFIAEENNDAVGYLKLSGGEKPKELIEKRTIQIDRIYVRKHLIGKKVGALLMQKCIEVAQNENCDTIWLGVWQENKTAIDFYLKWGFEIFGTKQFRIGNKVDDDYMMKKQTPPNY